MRTSRRSARASVSGGFSVDNGIIRDLRKEYSADEEERDEIHSDSRYTPNGLSDRST
ncbi:hypothetical protein GCM10010243_56300 [Streptomyces matensis]|nr:hypothetical protein GCM10010243_56300 [Streptomyces matensis]